MGVDARMFVRLKGQENWLAERDVVKTAYYLASTIGPGNFYITLDSDLVSRPHHCLEIMEPENDDGELDPTGRVYWSQDGPDIEPDADEQFVQVHLSSRYYGEGYARGDWPTIRVIAEWLAIRFPKGEIWYGGDSSGICAEHLTSERIAELTAFFLATGRKTYTRYPGFCEYSTPPCIHCRVPMIDTGGGNDARFLYCDGCNRTVVSAGGFEHLVPAGGDVFKTLSEIRKHGTASC